MRLWRIVSHTVNFGDLSKNGQSNGRALAGGSARLPLNENPTKQ
jgi:hypothetical protein